MSVNVTITGCTGRMGLQLLQAVQDAEDVTLIGALAPSGNSALGKDVGELLHRDPIGVTIVDDINAAIQPGTTVIDFTRPAATLAYLPECVKAKSPMVIGTSGFSETELEQIRAASQHIPIVYSNNMSIGVNLCFKLLKQAAQVLGDDYDVEVVEAHHRHKVDAPSGTALSMGEAVAEGLGRDLKQCAVYAREGHTGERPANAIGFSTIRAGDIIGDHTVMFAGPGERVEITHHASDRMIYAVGALRAAQWLTQRTKGLFTMQDVLAASFPLVDKGKTARDKDLLHQ